MVRKPKRNESVTYNHSSLIDDRKDEYFSPSKPITAKETEKLKDELLKIIESMKEELVEVKQANSKIQASFNDKLDRSLMINFEAQMKKEIETHGKRERAVLSDKLLSLTD